jgi:nucleotide-binding universal stress UspA family protein
VYKRILVPLDGSRLAEQALPHAPIHAEKFGAEIVLLMVLGPLLEPSMAGRRIVRSAEEAAAQLAQTYLEDIAAGLRERGLPVQTQTVEGRPYLEIVCHAEDRVIDLIVMTTRGHSELSRWLLGSVTDRVVRDETVRLLLVQCQEDPGMGDDQHS